MAFFDELSKKISSTASRAGQVAGDTAEIAKLKMQISSEQDKIRKAYAELGKQYYEAHRNDPSAEFSELIGEIERSFTAIQNANVSIQEHKSNISTPLPSAAPSPVRPVTPPKAQICPTCGNQVQAGSRFCTFCGSEMPVVTTPVCANCGTVLEPGTKFCTACGTPVTPLQTTVSPMPSEEPELPSEPVELPEPEVIVEPTLTFDTFETEEPSSAPDEPEIL